MSFAIYQAAIARLATEEQNGDDIEDGIAALAASANQTYSDIRAAITEHQDLVAA